MGLLACDRAAAPVDATVSDAETRDVVADDHRDAAAEGAPRDRVIPADARDATAADSMDAGDDVRDGGLAVDAREDAPEDATARDSGHTDDTDAVGDAEVDVSGPPAIHATSDVLARLVFAGWNRAFVTAVDGTLWGWGANGGAFQPSSPSVDPEEFRVQPQRIDGVLNVREAFLDLSPGYAPCVLAGSATSGGSIYCWGSGPYSRYGLSLGDAWSDWRFPHQMGTISDVLHLYLYSAIRSDNSLWRIASRDSGWSRYTERHEVMLQGVSPGVIRTSEGVQAGDYLSNYMDSDLQRISGIVDIAGAPDFSCILLDTGRVMCWGINAVAQTGTGYEGTEVCHWTVRDSPTSSHTAHVMCVRRPTLVPGLTDVVKVALGEGVGCALRREGTVWCWGWNVAMSDGRGTLGDGRPAAEEQCVPYDVVDGGVVPEPSRAVTCRRAPTRVSGIDDAIDISVGVDFQCAVRATGQVLCWGFNDYGQLGTGDTMARALPTPVRWY